MASVSVVLRTIIPRLTQELHKGQCGRIGVVGGSFEYTGAPYFAALSALRTGADISHVFCDAQAATAIKSYSPDLIVHPVLITAEELDDALSFEEKAIACAQSIQRWFPSLGALAIGSGLGRDRLVTDSTLELIRLAREENKPIVLDGDALFILSQDENVDVVRGYSRCILTPNHAELMRLVRCATAAEGARKLAQSLGNVTVVLKGPTDLITNGIESIECTTQASPRRCGGQGDILAGAVATFAAWASNVAPSNEMSLPPLLDACHAACQLVRHASFAAFNKHKRAMTAVEVLAEVGPSFYELYDKQIEQEPTSSS